MPKLGARLNTVLRSVPTGSVVADIGTDHAFLPIALIESKKAIKVIAADVKEKPLNNARENVEKSGLDNIELRLSDGLSAISEGEANCVTIAGMGGNVIRDILIGADWIKNSSVTLVLQAMSSAEVLREYLYREGFSIISENGVSDTGRIYSVITAVFSGIPIIPDAVMLYTGELKNDPSPDATEYIKLQYARLSSAAESLKNAKGKEAEYKAVFLAAEQIKKLLTSR